jgi:hypothetical protein
MASDVGIVNAALRKLGHGPITEFSEHSKAARLANERYAELRDSLLHRHPWNFAMKRRELAASTTAPAWGFEIAYPLPADYIRMHEVNGEDENTAKWKVEDGAIVTNLPAPLQVRYVYRVTDANRMSLGFREALASILASDWAEDITGDDSVVTEKERKARFAVAQARSNDGQEGTPDQFESDEWLNARL